MEVNYLERREFTVVCRVVAILLGAIEMLYLILRFSRSWHLMGPYSQCFAVILVTSTPLIAIHLLKKQPNPYIIGLTAYAMLFAACFLLFPFVP